MPRKPKLMFQICQKLKAGFFFIGLNLNSRHKITEPGQKTSYREVLPEMQMASFGWLKIKTKPTYIIKCQELIAVCLKPFSGNQMKYRRN
jgi:hypothetical protein